jgi:hypothetical protein
VRLKTRAICSACLWIRAAEWADCIHALFSVFAPSASITEKFLDGPPNPPLSPSVISSAQPSRQTGWVLLWAEIFAASGNRRLEKIPQPGKFNDMFSRQNSGH